MEHKDCIILAGGLGTRLQSVVEDKPKCLAPIDGKPFLHYLLLQIQRYHFRNIIFSVGYKKEMVKDYLSKNANNYSFEYVFAEEEEPLGTGGAIMNAMQYVATDDAIVMNGDTLFDIDLDALYLFQKNNMADCTLALKLMNEADRYGIVHIDEQNSITSFEEKKIGASGLINGGIYCLFKKSFINIPFEKKFSFEKEYLEKMISERNFMAFTQDKYFIDIGIPTDYNKAQTEIPRLFN